MKHCACVFLSAAQKLEIGCRRAHSNVQSAARNLDMSRENARNQSPNSAVQWTEISFENQPRNSRNQPRECWKLAAIINAITWLMFSHKKSAAKVKIGRGQTDTHTCIRTQRFMYSEICHVLPEYLFMSNCVADLPQFNSATGPRREEFATAT